MELILDTHSFLYFIEGNSKLSNVARALIEDSGNEKWISMASLWEMAIKVSLGKLQLSGSFDALIPRQIKINGFSVLDIHIEHVSAVVELPFHHKDPFDRLLIAQSLSEGFPIVSSDGAFDSYSVKRLW
jgi:PIN domain nuclease of toxin-antitoxin system